MRLKSALCLRLKQKSPGLPEALFSAQRGESYVNLARRAARSLRIVHPDAEIDLFTDHLLEDPIFTKVHALSESWFRPKMEALLRSRFERTILLDADIMVVADLTAVFDVLDRFDIAAAQDRKLNSDPALNIHACPLPDAFATVNSGVLAVRKSHQTRTFPETWRSEVMDSGARQDQPDL